MGCERLHVSGDETLILLMTDDSRQRCSEARHRQFSGGLLVSFRHRIILFDLSRQGDGGGGGGEVLSSSSFISYVSLKVISHERAIRAEITAQVDLTTDLLRLTHFLRRVGETRRKPLNTFIEL